MGSSSLSKASAPRGRARYLIAAAGLSTFGMLVGLRLATSSEVSARAPARREASERAAAAGERPAVVAAAEAAAPSPSDVRSAHLDPRQQFAAAMIDRGEPVPPANVITMIEGGLAATGPSSEPWTRDAEHAFVKLEAELGSTLRDARFKISRPSCFAAGCVVTIDYPPGTDVMALAQTMVTSEAIRGWPGGKLASPSIDGVGGAPSNRWVLLRPDQL